MSDQQKLNRIALEDGIYETRLTAKFARRKPYEKHDPHIIKAAIPGVVAEIDTSVGSAVRRGETMIVLEAMKMLNRIMAPLDGTIQTIRVSKGEKVAKGQVLIEIK